MTRLTRFGFVVLVLALALRAPASAGVAGTLTLKAAVQVADDEVTLGDLVGRNDVEFPSALVICHAPDAGSVRMLSMEEVASALRKHEAIFHLRGPEMISVMRTGRRITSADLQPLITAALSNGGGAGVSDVRLQAAIFATDVSSLRLRKLRFDPAIQKYRAWFVTSDAPHAASFEALATLRPGTSLREINAGKVAPSTSGVTVLVHRGETAAMQLAGEGFSATLTVVSLESGAMDKVVRVRETATKQIYRAQVTGRGTLRAVSRAN